MLVQHVNKCGALVVAWDDDELQALAGVLRDNEEAGDAEARLMGPSELFALEPSLSRRARGAVFCPREAVVGED